MVVGMTTSSESTTATTSLTAGSWALDPLHSSVEFSIRHLGISKVRGRFARFETEFVVDESGAATIGATIDLDSFDTGNADRDAHVRTADFLDVASRPTLSFRATEPVPIAESFVVQGEATLGAVTKPVTLEVEWGGVQDFGPNGDRHAGFSATGTIKRTDFGVGGPLPGMLSDTVKIELEIQLIEPKP
jgi:polyisoprenoid-binding protein YceI